MIMRLTKSCDSVNLFGDCGFGIGTYATKNAPGRFANVDGILKNNYPRATKKP